MLKHYSREMPLLRWAQLLALLVLLPLVGRAQSQTISTTVVISQVYGGGGNMGAQYTNDFIELHNISGSPVNLAGYSVQYASATGTSWTTTPLTSIMLAAGAYYLIQEAAGATASAALPTPDATGTLAMSGASGKVALVNSTTALIGCSATANIIDMVAYGPTSTCSEGSAPTVVLTNTTAAVRPNGSCVDTNNNGADFIAAAPAPRNSAPASVFVCPAPEINVKQGTTTYLTSTTYSGFADTSIGSSNTKTFTIENLGNASLTVSGISVTGTNSTDYSSSASASGTVAAGSSTTFTVTFTPTAAGTRTANIIIANNDADESSYVVRLSATGLAAPCGAPGTPSFTNVQQTSASVLVMAGPNGTGPFFVTATPTAGGTAITGSGTSPVSLTGLTAGSSYSVTATSVCNVGYGSPSQTSAAATLTTTAATPNPQIALSQGGTGIANGGSYSGFASTAVGSTSAPVTFSIANASTTDNLTLGTFVLTGPFALSGAQPTAVAANGTPATFSLTFTPTATGANIGTLTIPNNSQTNNPYVINIGGLGTSATPTDLTVGTTQAIAGSYRNVTVSSTGRALVVGPLVVSGALIIQAGGVLSQNCQTISGAGSFEVQAGALLGICDAAGIVTTGAVGAVQVTGLRTFSPAAGYSYTNPTTAQVTGPGLPAQIFGLGVDNPAGVTLSQGVAVAQQVTLLRGNITTGGLPFTLLSTAAGTAVVDNTGGVVNGTATVQRYIDNANPVGYRHYSAPVSNTTMSDLATTGFTPTFNTAYNNSPTPGTIRPFPTVFGYDQSRIATVTSTASAFDKGWFSPAANDAMAVNRGYTVNAPTTALVDFVGTLNNGVQNSGALSRGADVNAGWQFLGNPYPAPLDWSTVTPAQRPGMDAAMYVFQSSGQYGGSYRTYTNGVGPLALIDVASGYFARVTAPGTSGAVNLTNANRVLTFGTQPAFGRGLADTRPQLQLQLRGTTGLDDAYVYFQAGATAGIDAEFDAVKLANPTGLNLASVVGAQTAAINGLPLLGNAAVVVPLTVGVPQAGNYSFSAAEVANFTGTVTLLDALGNTRTVLAPGTTYAFTTTGTSAIGRFVLEFRPAGVLAATPAQALAAQVQLFPNPASASFRVQLPVLGSKAAVAATLTNTLGQTVLSRSLSAPAGQAISAEFDVRALAAGVYTLRLTVDGTLLVRKVVVE